MPDLPDGPGNLSRRKKTIPFVASWTALWYYEGNVRESLLRYKFGGRESYAKSYGRLLAMTLLEEDWTYDRITWVPISRRRKLRRGYDPGGAAGRAAAKELGREAEPVLRKLRHNPPQSGIHGAAERRANVLGAYGLRKGVSVEGQRILLLDDIITTGATVSECARELLSAGAKEVVCGCVAGGRPGIKEKLGDEYAVFLQRSGCGPGYGQRAHLCRRQGHRGPGAVGGGRG